MRVGTFAIHSLILLLMTSALAGHGAASPSVPDRAAVISHDLDIELIPGTHELIGQDRVVIELPSGAEAATFSLAPTLRVESVVWIDHADQNGVSRGNRPLAFTANQLAELSSQRIVVTLPQPHEGRLTLGWTYRGAINDPPKEPRHLRFVTPSETAGYIGPEGVYLSGESQWYPDIDGSFSAYRLTVSVPDDWTVVTQGKKIAASASGGRSSTTWVVADRSEALTLVANTFVTKTREWNSRDGQRVELVTYFFPEDARLADEYLDATAKYLDAYIPLLGEFPFGKFAVVENFFASGLGMPSFTLLGSGSIQRHYVQPYALGHEIVHSWIGNSVFNRSGHGNWVEGLTTYLANYYWHELTHDDRQALEQRRMMLQGYAIYVDQDREYPVARFVTKSDERDNAIGYHKSAFVFHLLRREIGEEAFWRGLKTFVSRYRNHPADWGDIETVFAQESRRDLRWFFAQWVEQSGAPVLALGDARAHRIPGNEGANAWRLAVRVEQNGRRFQMAVPIKIVMQHGAETRWVPLGSSVADTADLIVPDQPLSVQLDPDLTVFRRLARSHMPPMLNGYVTDPHRTVVRAFSDPASPMQQVLSRIADQESQLPDSRKTLVLSDAGVVLPSDGSVLVLAGSDQERAVRSIVEESCGDLVRLGATGFQIAGQKYDGPDMAVLFSCHRAKAPGSVVTILYGVSPGAVEKVSRFLFYYGWQSYVIFKGGAAVKRDLWQHEPEMKEVWIDGTR